jgi:hypothetical protein
MIRWFYQQDMVMFVVQGHALASKGYPEPHTMIHRHLYEQGAAHESVAQNDSEGPSGSAPSPDPLPSGSS